MKITQTYGKKKIMKIFYEEKRQFLFELTHSEYVHGNTYSFISFFFVRKYIRNVVFIHQSSSQSRQKRVTRGRRVRSHMALHLDGPNLKLRV